MNTRFRFKLMIALISLSLTGLLLSQGYWLRGLYTSNKERTEKSIREAMQMADYKEIFIRIDSLDKNNYHGQIQPSILFGFDSTEQSIDTTFQYSDITESLREYLQIISGLEGQIQMAIHQKIDSLAPINYSQYYNQLSLELDERNLKTPFCLQVIQRGATDSVLYTHTDALHEKQSRKNAAHFTFPIEAENYYSVWIESPYQIVFRQMAGILISSLLLVVVILGAFVYLLYTILRQKTVEELKTDFTNNMTHELKTPISVAFAANDVLLNYSAPVSEKQHKYLTIVHEQLTRLSGLVEQILTLSVENRSTFRLRPEPVRLSELLSSLIEQYKLKSEKQISFTIEVPTDTTVTADRTHLYNILSNLIENAIKYSGENTCTISIKSVTLPDGISLAVSDRGIGISETNQKHIFDQFFRVPSGNQHNVKGYGLGLYYVSNMMARHQGSVTVKSQPGKGSTFTLHFKN